MLDCSYNGPGRTGFSPNIRHMAPELLVPSDFGLKNDNPTKKSDIYAFGVVMYQVGNAGSFGHSGSSSI